MKNKLEIALAIALTLGNFCVRLCAQELPTAPEPKLQEYVPPPAISWHDTFHSKKFWAADAVFALSIAGDEYMTLRGERHGCFEAGDSGPYRVSFGRMGAVDWGTFAAVTGVGLLMRKVHIPFASYVGPLAAASKHGLGMAHWAQTGCL